MNFQISVYLDYKSCEYQTIRLVSRFYALHSRSFTCQMISIINPIPNVELFLCRNLPEISLNLEPCSSKLSSYFIPKAKIKVIWYFTWYSSYIFLWSPLPKLPFKAKEPKNHLMPFHPNPLALCVWVQFYCTSLNFSWVGISSFCLSWKPVLPVAGKPLLIVQ